MNLLGHRPPDWRLIRYSDPATMENVLAALQTVLLIHVVVVVAVPFTLLWPSGPLNWWCFAVAVLFDISLLSMNARDWRDYRRAAVQKITARRTFTEMCLAAPAATFLGLTSGDQLGMVRPLLTLSLLFAAIAFDVGAIICTWLMCLAGLAAITLKTTSSIGDSVRLTILYAVGWGIFAFIVRVMRRTMLLGKASSDATAELGEMLGHISSWTDGIEPCLPIICRALDTDRVSIVLCARQHGGEPTIVDRPAGWIDHATLLAGVDDIFAPASEASSGDVGFIVGSGPNLSVVLAVPKIGSGGWGIRISLATPATVASLLVGAAERLGLIDDLLALSVTDELTGLGNRRHLFDAIEREIERARRTGQPLSLAMLDIDHFKDYNDRFGHPAGDRLLKGFAGACNSRLRSVDVLDRYGGEEFCLLMPGTSADGAVTLLEQIRSRGVDGDGGRVTLSTGVAVWDRIETSDWLIRRADLALYEAKETGRDRINVALPNERNAAPTAMAETPPPTEARSCHS